MSLQLLHAVPGDAARIAEIHMAAFGGNRLLKALFPAPDVRRDLQISIARKASADILDSKTAVLVVKDHSNQSDKDNVIAFAKWSLPVLEGEAYEEPAWEWPAGTNRGALDSWSNKTEAASEAILSSEPAYHLTFLGTLPEHQGRGAGKLLVQWATELCESDQHPLYLESTIEAAGFYRSLGFIEEDRISMEISLSPTHENELYEEIVLVYRPSRKVKRPDE